MGELATIEAESQLEKAKAAELQRSLMSALDRQRKQEICKEARARQAAASNMDVRLLQQQCLQERTSAERALQLLMQSVNEEERHQQELAECEHDRIERLQREENAIRGEAARRAAGKEYLRGLSLDAADRRAVQRGEREVEQLADRARADQMATHMQNEDLQRMANQRQAQAKLHAALDQLVEGRNIQKYDEIASGMAAEQEAEEFNAKKRAFAEKLADERRLAEASRQHVLHRLEVALSTKQLQTHAAQELCEVVRYEERLLKQREEEEMELRRKLIQRMACIHAWQESIDALEHRRLVAKQQGDRERQEMLQQFAEKEKLEQLCEHRQRMKRLAHSREVEHVLKEKQEQQEWERRKELKEIEAKKKQDEHEALIIQEERRRLLDAYGLCQSGVQLGHLLDAARNHGSHNYHYGNEGLGTRWPL